MTFCFGNFSGKEERNLKGKGRISNGYVNVACKFLLLLPENL